jgi:methylenetetrahydrofolate reductase (NADPH)
MTFKDSLKTKDFVVTAKVNLAEAPNRNSLIRQCEILRPVVDAAQLTDTTKEHMSGVAAAAILIQQGIDPIVHMSCRDRNRIALQKDLIGATALGVTSVLVRRGKKLPKGKKLGITNVFDTTALDFMAYIQNLKQDDNASIVSDFMLGANAELFDPDDDWTPKNLIKKCDAGVNFVQLQICFDIGVVRNYMERIVSSKLARKAHFIAALSPLPSADGARWVRDNVKGAIVPEFIIDRMERSPNPTSEGIDICAELLQELATIPGVSGADLSALGDIEAIPAAIDASGVRL